ncbi:MAG: hypothetical protein KAG18_03140, partial [Sinobacterium sp.]|nr:hypothetical protein [Sinobacterium sp.]
FRPDLKDFRIRSNAMGKLVNMGGKAKAISHGQINLFGPRGLVAKEAAHAFALKSKVSAYKKAFLSRKFLKYSHNFAHASVGLGVDKLIELTGLEASIGNEYASEMAGVISFGATSSLGNSVFDKAFKGKSIRKSLASDAGKFLSKNKGTIINIGKKLIRKRFKF